MVDLLQHPALLAWRHACQIDFDAVFDSDAQSDEWAEAHNCADSLRHLFSKEIPRDVWNAYMAEEARHGRAPAAYLNQEANDG